MISSDFLPRLAAIILLCVSFSQSLSASSQTTVNEPIVEQAAQITDQLSQQRSDYASAKAALKKNDHQLFTQYKAQLEGYPLYPHLEYAELIRHLPRVSAARIDGFLSRYNGEPVANRLRIHWLNQLAKQDNWPLFLKHYRSELANTSMQCDYQYARYQQGHKNEALNGALSLWNVGKSQPKACDKLFALLTKHEKITETIAWQRYSKAVLNHKYRLARYLQRYFHSEERRALATNFYKVDRTPSSIGNYHLFDEHTPEVNAVIAHGLRHLAHENARKAMAHWSHYQQTHSFDTRTRSQIIHALIKGLYRQGYPHVADGYLLDNLELVSSDLLEWRARQALADLDWTALKTWVSQMPAELQRDARWRYWLARAEISQNPAEAATQPLKKQHLEKQSIEKQPLATYRELATTRSFYGFLAADHLGIQYSMAHESSDPDPTIVNTLKNSTGALRTRELLHHREYFMARLEWRHTSRNFSEQQWIAAAHLTREWNWHHGSINSMIKASFWNDIKLRFPLAYNALFRREAAETELPLHLLFALARQESAMSQSVTSPAGAKGLMQLMPATARQTAKRNGVHYTESNDLFEPDTNIRLGSRYYKEMMSRYNNRILATAAYNAGPGRVDRWLERSGGKLPFDVWIENIPFKETRGYVQNVLAFSMIYAHQLGSEESMLSVHELEQLL